ncbi:MAG TPA: DoxX family protein [Chloroflexota bacterium]|nr:DoxX family protein [Chloroflexota bacterium]
MNVVLWVFQVVLAVLYLAGGAYKVRSGGELERRFGLSGGAWGAIGVLEMLGGVLLIVPAAVNWMPELTPLAAGVLVVEAVALTVLYARRSLRLTPSNPLTFAVVMGVLAACVAYGRYVPGVAA